MLAQAPEDTFAGGISVGFCQDIELHKPMCKGEDLHFTPRADGKGIDLKPGAKLRNPWTVLHGEVDEDVRLRPTREFVSATPDATLMALPKVGHGYSVAANWSPQFLAAFNAMREQHRAAALPPPPASLADLPLIEVPAQGPPGDVFRRHVVRRWRLGGHGQGNRRGTDRQGHSGRRLGLAALFLERRARPPDWPSIWIACCVTTPITGRRRTPSSSVTRRARTCSPSASTACQRARVRWWPQSVMIAPGLLATFEFHFGNWFGGSVGRHSDSTRGGETRPARTLCIHGLDETDSLCPQIDGKSAHSVSACPAPTISTATTSASPPKSSGSCATSMLQRKVLEGAGAARPRWPP